MVAGGPFAGHEAIKELGTNGGGPLNANAAHPFENPNAITNLLEMFLILVIPFALTYAFGRFAKVQRQGWSIFAAMFMLWAASAVIAQAFEVGGNPRLDEVGATQAVSATSIAGNMEGKEVRLGSAACALHAATTTGTSTGSVNCFHDSMTPAGGAVEILG